MKKILIVDDEKSHREILAEYFHSVMGVEDITFACDGFDAFTESSLRSFDLICLDHMMPHCKGDQFLSALRKKTGPNQQTAVFMITAHIPEISDEMRSSENVYFMEKPLDFSRLNRYAKIIFSKK